MGLLLSLREANIPNLNLLLQIQTWWLSGSLSQTEQNKCCKGGLKIIAKILIPTPFLEFFILLEVCTSIPDLSNYLLNSCCHDPNSTLAGLDLKMTLHTTRPPPHPTTTQTQCQQYLSCYLHDFDETLNVGSCEHLEQKLNPILNPEPNIEPQY